MRAAIVFIVGLLAAGCAQPRVQPAFVDYARVTANLAPSGPAVLPQSPDVSIDTQGSIAPRAGEVVRSANNEARRAAILQLIAENRLIAENDLAERLREAYLAEVDRLESEMLGDLDERRKKLLESTFASLRPIFEEYAQRRTAPLVRLSLYAGFPDPDPNSRRPLPEAEKFALARAKDAVDKRKQLQQIEAWYQAQVEGALQKASDDISEQIVNLRIELERQRLDAETRARREAAAQVNTELADINPSLAQSAPLVLKASPGETVRVASGRSPLVISPPPDRSATILRQAREQARLDAKVWAATEGYRLSESRSAPDKTDEFLAWRRKRHVGP